jgi:hypothetical protein
MGKAGIYDSGDTTRLAEERDAWRIREMHLLVVWRAERKMGET